MFDMCSQFDPLFIWRTWHTDRRPLDDRFEFSRLVAALICCHALVETCPRRCGERDEQYRGGDNAFHAAAYNPTYFRHSIKTVYVFAIAAMSAVGMILSDLAVSYGTSCASRNARAVPSLMAKFTFWGSRPVRRAIFNASSLATTTPTTWPDPSSAGPPLLPGWTGAVI